MRLAIVVIALSFASGVALAALAMKADRARAAKVAVPSAEVREDTAAAAPDEFARNSSPTASLPPTATQASLSVEANSIADDVESLPGWAPGSAAIELQLTGVNYQWEVRYPGLLQCADSDGKPWVAGRASREIHLPAETEVRLHLKSRDFVYLLIVPSVDGDPNQKSQIAVPSQRFTLDFNTGPERTLVLSGDHLCGLPRPSLDLTVIVQSQQEFQSWLDDQRK